MQLQLNLVLLHGSIFMAFLLFLLRAKRKKGLRLFDQNGFVSNLPVLFELQLAGILFFGVVPALFVHPQPIILVNLIRPDRPLTWLILLLILASFIITPKILMKKLRTMKSSSSVFKQPCFSVFVLYFIIRTMFIVAYESWFRGYLLSDTIFAFGILRAVLLNISLYAILHLNNGRDEFFAAFPYGLLLCALCILQGAVWPAIIIHLVLTLPYELGFVRRLRLILSHPV